MSTDQEWNLWGIKDPYFGVLSDKKYHINSIDLHKEEFYRSGEFDIDRFLTKYNQFFGNITYKSSLDFGSGVGRLSFAMAKKFESVTGLDISTGMIEEAKKNAGNLKINNVTFKLPSEENSEIQYDFINSYIVLQHIPKKIGLDIIDTLAKKVKPHGGIMIHVSIKRSHNSIQALIYWCIHNLPIFNSLVNMIKGRSIHAPRMQMNNYDLSEIIKIFNINNMKDIVLNYEKHGNVDTVLIYSKKN